MKNHSLIVLIGIIFLFSSCEETLYTVLIKNESSKSVSYVYDGDSNTLSPGDHRFYDEVKAYTQPPKDISVPGAMSIRMENYQGEVFTFVDTKKITLSVTNELDFRVKLKASNYYKLPFVAKTKADDYIDAGNDLTEMHIAANAGPSEAFIYTERPEFTTSPQQYTVEWKFDGDTTMDVIIK